MPGWRRLAGSLSRDDAILIGACRPGGAYAPGLLSAEDGRPRRWRRCRIRRFRGDFATEHHAKDVVGQCFDIGLWPARFGDEQRRYTPLGEMGGLTAVALWPRSGWRC